MRVLITALIAISLLSACSGGDSVSALGKSPTQARTSGSISFKYQSIDDPSSTVNRVNGIDQSGDIVGTTGDGNASDPYKSYLAKAPYTTFQDETYPGADGTMATSLVSVPGQTIVGGWVLNPLPGIWAFVQINGVWSIFRNLKGGRGPDTATEVLGLNNAGFGVGYFRNTSGNNVPVIINIPTENFTALRPPGYVSAEATGINDFGDIVGWETTSTTTIGFFERLAVYYTFAFPKAKETFALGINSADQVVGYYVDSSETKHGFILTNPKSGKKWQTIDEPSAAHGTVVTGINDDDSICGYYFDASGVQHGFIATAN